MEINKRNNYYTAERNVQIVISILKANGIKRVIASPGTTNMTFVGSIQQDSFFEIYSSVDERSAAYLACGMAAETGEPVVLSCTGATASRNYMPGLTEAYYRKLPILAITSHRGDYQLGHLIDQQIDRRSLPNDIAIEHVVLPMVKDSNDEKYCTIEANKAILALKLNGGGPVHINLFTEYNRDFSIKELPPTRVIRRYSIHDKLPTLIKKGKTVVSIGAHRSFTQEETSSIDTFCATHNAVVLCDHTSNYYGKYSVHMALVFCQENWYSHLKNVDLMIHIGEVTGNVFRAFPSRVWRISEDGALRDPFNKLTTVFMMPEKTFFDYYSQHNCCEESFLQECKEEYDEINKSIPNLPFSNIWIAQQLAPRLPQNSVIHLGIYNSLRSWNFFNLPDGVTANSNVGGFGIDGGVSSMIGASIAKPEKLFFGIFGDLAFFYDMNVLGNRHVGKNVRILLINNGKGNEFRLYCHPCRIFGEDAEPYMAAAGHYGNKSSLLVKHYAEDLGYKYLSARSKEEFLSVMNLFCETENTSSPIVFEVFTNTEDESNALKAICTIKKDSNYALKKKIKNNIRTKLGKDGIETIKKILGK